MLFTVRQRGVLEEGDRLLVDAVFAPCGTGRKGFTFWRLYSVAWCLYLPRVLVTHWWRQLEPISCPINSQCCIAGLCCTVACCIAPPVVEDWHSKGISSKHTVYDCYTAQTIIIVYTFIGKLLYREI